MGGQTSGTAPVKNPGATFYIPTENEWYKAACYSPLLNSGSGGYWFSSDPLALSSTYRTSDGPYTPSDERLDIGFRLAAVPEPSTLAMGVAGIACGAWQAIRRRTRA